MKAVGILAVSLLMLCTNCTAQAAMYIRVDQDGNGTVSWSNGLEGFYEDSEDDGGMVCFDACRTKFFLFSDDPKGFVYDTDGQPVDEYYMYFYNEDTGEYEYAGDDEPADAD